MKRLAPSSSAESLQSDIFVLEVYPALIPVRLPNGDLVRYTTGVAAAKLVATGAGALVRNPAGVLRYIRLHRSSVNLSTRAEGRCLNNGSRTTKRMTNDSGTVIAPPHIREHRPIQKLGGDEE